MPIYALEGISPEIDASAWVAPGAQIMGKVRLAAEASVWYGAVLRGDNAWIEVGAGSNVQDLTVCHTDVDCPLRIGADVTVGHRAILHGCTIGDGVLVGMGACVMNRARIGAGSLVGAGALVTEDAEIPERSLVLGAPAKVVRAVDDATVAKLLASAAHYVRQAARHRDGLRRCDGGGEGL